MFPPKSMFYFVYNFDLITETRIIVISVGNFESSLYKNRQMAPPSNKLNIMISFCIFLRIKLFINTLSHLRNS